MNIITADFNWISLLLIVGGAIFSIIKASKKDDTKSIFQNTDFETEDESGRIYQERENTIEVNERYTMAERTKQTNPLKKEKPIPIIPKKEEEFEFDLTIEEEEEFQFDIRQAIIGSEILRRPEY